MFIEQQPFTEDLFQYDMILYRHVIGSEKKTETEQVCSDGEREGVGGGDPSEKCFFYLL